MPKPNALVKISGDMLEHPMVADWLKEISKKYSVVILSGGGTQVNRAFKENGWPVRFGPLGRRTTCLTHKQVARDTLETNEAMIQDRLDRKNIPVRTAIPVIHLANVFCHVNGDIMVLAAYNGFDKIFVVTTPERVKHKEKFFNDLSKTIGKGSLEKIQVKSF